MMDNIKYTEEIESWPIGAWCFHGYELGQIGRAFPESEHVSFLTPHFTIGTRGPIFPLTMRNLAIAGEVEYWYRKIKEHDYSGANWPRIVDRLEDFAARAMRLEESADLKPIYAELKLFGEEIIEGGKKLQSMYAGGIPLLRQ